MLGALPVDQPKSHKALNRIQRSMTQDSNKQLDRSSFLYSPMDSRSGNAQQTIYAISRLLEVRIPCINIELLN